MSRHLKIKCTSGLGLRLRASGLGSSANNYSTVILSGVCAPRSEAHAESKDPCPQAAACSYQGILTSRQKTQPKTARNTFPVARPRFSFMLRNGRPWLVPRPLEIAQRQLQSSELGMIVVIESERDIQSVSGKQFRLLNALGHAPAQRIVSNRPSPIPLRTLSVEARQNPGIRVTSRRDQNRNFAELFLRLISRRRR